jgi:hypothetical protein
VNAYWIAFGVITGFLVFAVLGMLSSLKGQWSLAGALSEKKTVTVNAQSTTTQEAGGSASRLIATLGTLVLAAIMLGVGYAMIWSLFTRGQIPALEGIGPYLLGGAALFAPYAFNQLKEAFK